MNVAVTISDRFDACLGEELIVVSRQQLYDGARALVGRGYDPETLLTIRHVGKDLDSFEPQPINELVKVDHPGERKARLTSPG